MPANALCLDEREEIRAGIERDESGRQIAELLGRSPSTVCREIERNGGRSEYRAATADRRACRQRKRPKEPMLVADPELAAHVLERLNEKDSPWTISVELAAGRWGVSRKVSHETIYQAIYAQGLQRDRMRTPHLKRFRRRRRGQTATGKHPLEPFTPIAQRPAAADERSEVGHLEGDLIVGAYNQSALITLVDRCSRRLWIIPTKSKNKNDVYRALLRAYRQIPEPARKTLTWDQGAEIARHRELAHKLDVDIYITEPKSPWQRPSNENMNAHLRRYVGKGTNLKQFNNTQLDAIETRINTTPRRIFNKRTANDIYTDAIAMTG